MTRILLIAFAASTARVTKSVAAQTEQPTTTVEAAQLAVSRFKDKEVFTTGGNPAGMILDVAVADDGQHYAIVNFGKDLGTRQVPISNFAYENNRFTLTGLNEEQLPSLPTYTDGQAGLRLAEAGTALSVFGWTA